MYEKEDFYLSRSGLLWVHAVFAVLYLVIAIVFMRHFSVNLEYQEDEQVSTEINVYLVYTTVKMLTV